MTISALETIFELVIATSPEKFLTWFFHDWDTSEIERFSCDSGVYKVELQHIEPGELKYSEPVYGDSGEVFVTHEITFDGIPGQHSKIGIISSNESLKEVEIDESKEESNVLALGYMTILEIANEKIHIKGMVFDEAPFDTYLVKIGKHISEIFSPTYKYFKDIAPELTQKPTRDDSDEKWIEYFHYRKYETDTPYTWKQMAHDRQMQYWKIRKIHIGCPICSERRRKNKENKYKNK